MLPSKRLHSFTFSDMSWAFRICGFVSNMAKEECLMMYLKLGSAQSVKLSFMLEVVEFCNHVLRIRVVQNGKAQRLWITRVRACWVLQRHRNFYIRSGSRERAAWTKWPPTGWRNWSAIIDTSFRDGETMKLQKVCLRTTSKYAYTFSWWNIFQKIANCLRLWKNLGT